MRSNTSGPTNWSRSRRSTSACASDCLTHSNASVIRCVRKRSKTPWGERPMTTLDTQAFHRFEHAGWETAARAYHQSWTALTMQAVAPLLDAAHVGRGTRLLDVATGPGHVAGLAAERGASAVGVDFAAAMLTLAREQYPYVQFGEGDATALPFPSLSFDAVVSNFGI